MSRCGTYLGNGRTDQSYLVEGTEGRWGWVWRQSRNRTILTLRGMCETPMSPVVQRTHIGLYTLIHFKGGGPTSRV